VSVLALYSFHSVKGGVGKSTLATLNALQLAKKHPDARVLLVDMDLTGTSLADVLPLQAPRVSEDNVLALDSAAAEWCSVDDTRAAVRRRGDEVDPRQRHVAFLNDYLLFAPLDGSLDADPRSLFWKYNGAPKNLDVLPSSALPRDLQRILPVIFDEHQSAFLEARLETLISRVLSSDRNEADETLRDLHVVLDVPPTIPGLSRAVLSAVMRLSARDGVVDLADNRPTDRVFQDIETRRGRAFVVTSRDLQDLRAAARWLRATTDDRVRVIVNRSDEGSAVQMRDELRDALGGAPTGSVLDAPTESADASDWAPQFASAIWVPNNPSLRIFRAEDAIPNEQFDWLEAEP